MRDLFGLPVLGLDIPAALRLDDLLGHFVVLLVVVFVVEALDVLQDRLGVSQALMG